MASGLDMFGENAGSTNEIQLQSKRVVAQDPSS